MDLLSEILNAANWKTHVLTSTRVYGPWGLRFPCDQSAGFHIVSQGSCLARAHGEPIQMQQGDLLFMGRGCLHELVSGPDAPVMDIREFNEQRNLEARAGTPVTTFISVFFEIPDAPLHPFLLELPDQVLVRATEIPVHHPIHGTLALASQEIDQGNGIGSDLVIQRMADILLFYVIRHWVDHHAGQNLRWVRAFHDDRIRHALEALHRQPAHPWSLGELAAAVGLSRAGFARRFREVLAHTPMDYLARLRIERGRALLRAGDATTLEDVARAVGYSSAFAYSKAHKRVFGRAPMLDLAPSQGGKYLARSPKSV
jgi:AraC-like DNA-binding protein